MKKWLQGVFSLFICLLGAIVIAQGGASAQGVQDFVITSMRAEYTLTNEDPQGRLVTKETINLVFSGQNRGILRAIPDSYGDANTHPRVLSVTRDGVSEPYITYMENGNTVVRIGDENTYITGEHGYVIEYVVENVIRFYDTHDELYWDVNGVGWLQPFNAIEAYIESNAPVSTDSTLRPVCYTGTFGATTQDCEINEATGRLRVATQRTLTAGETLTFVQTYEKGYFMPPTWWEQHWTKVMGFSVVAMQLVVAAFALRRWYREGRDYDRSVVAPYFERPKGVSVIEAGYVSEQNLQPKHMSAAIIDLAIRGYIKITETSDKKPKHELELVRFPDKNVAEDEKFMVHELFKDNYAIGAKIKIEDKKQKLYPLLLRLRTMADNSTNTKGYFELRPSKSLGAMTKYFLLGMLVMVVGAITAPGSYGVGLVVGFLVFILIVILANLMGKRSKNGMYLKEHMEGLKLYLGFSEKERLEKQDAVAAPLAPRSGEPVRDVQFFESLLPFAVALGVEKTWAEAFKDIYAQPPEWYGGNWSTFNSVALAHSLGQATKATNASFAAPSSSSGSGASGGGFSGGGGGGGGGGGW
jgi:uncharacterized membrane protein YgcG